MMPSELISSAEDSFARQRRIEEAERKVIEAAKVWHNGDGDIRDRVHGLDAAVDELLAVLKAVKQ